MDVQGPFDRAVRKVCAKIDTNDYFLTRLTVIALVNLFLHLSEHPRPK
jgi:hypothetical protein